MTNDPNWYESRRKISVLLAEGLIREFDESPVLTQERANLLTSILHVNDFSSDMLEKNRFGFYHELNLSGVSEEEIGRIPLFEGYDPKAR